MVISRKKSPVYIKQNRVNMFTQKTLTIKRRYYFHLQK